MKPRINFWQNRVVVELIIFIYGAVSKSEKYSKVSLF